VNAAKYIARLVPALGLYGTNPATASSVDSWVDFARANLKKSDLAQFGPTLDTLNSHLKMRVFFVGYSLTLADLVLFDFLRRKILPLSFLYSLFSSPHFTLLPRLKENPAWTRNVKSGTAQEKTAHVYRWFIFVEQDDSVQAALKTAKAGAKPKDQSTKDQGSKDRASYEIDLPGAIKGKVCTRFPPEPSGYLHIGHAKAALLNEFFAREYEGKLIVRFDDTNPSKEKEEYEHAIKEDLEMLHIKPDVVSYTSDFFPQIMEYAYQLIRSGDAYCDDTKQEEMRKERMDGIASRNRDASVELNLQRFEEMKKGTPLGQTFCLRAKMSVDSKNKAMRDPVMFRYNALPHARTGDKYKVYPTYDFAYVITLQISCFLD